MVIDRVNAKSPAAELLIEAAMTQTTSRPVTLVIDSYSRLRNFHGEATASCISRAHTVPSSPLPSVPH